jgi:hypothetical protein
MMGLELEWFAWVNTGPSQGSAGIELPEAARQSGKALVLPELASTGARAEDGRGVGWRMGGALAPGRDRGDACGESCTLSLRGEGGGDTACGRLPA